MSYDLSNYGKLTKKAIFDSISGLSEPSKMPCYSYSISNQHCITGSKLKNTKGTVCNLCYADKGNYTFPCVKSCHEKRYNKMTSDSNWINNMTIAIKKLSPKHFRWFDSGDIQSLQNLKDIIQICNNTSKTKHWLPTREYGIVNQFVNEGGIIPSNLTIRLSAYKINSLPPSNLANRLGVLTSTVTSTDDYNCPAPKQGNKCLNCRKCWDKSINNIAYSLH